MPLSGTILIIEDEERLRQLLTQILSLEGHIVISADTAMKGLALLEEQDIQLVLTDVKLPDLDGITLTERVKMLHPLIEVIVLTAYGTIEGAVKAMKIGAFDYITKGEHDEQIPLIVVRALESIQLKRQLRHLQERVASQSNFERIIGNSPRLFHAVDLARKVATTDTTVLLLGETGTGKEVFAEAIHQASRRAAEPFIAVNCAAIPKDIQESELFGHRKGAFTGALYDKKGLLEEADRGTLFLDEIGEMSESLQAGLLRAIETRSFHRLGDARTISVDVRIIAATNRNLIEESKTGRFRKDLFYRISPFSVELPPLRERSEDIEVLAIYFAGLYAGKLGKQMVRMNEDFMACLKRYSWPGNVRELKNVIERAIILTDSPVLTPGVLPPEFHPSSAIASELELASIEKNHILRVLDLARGDKTEAAHLLHIGLTTLYRKLKEYGVEE